MSFHYTRESGPEGQILTEDGDANGVLLSELLRAGPLPVRAALELVAYAGDLISIAEEDRETHGDLQPAQIAIDAAGAVSLQGYGVPRRGGRAPEGNVAGVATDVYGLGMVLHAVLSSQSLGAVPRDRDAHDDFVVEQLMQLDWQDLAGRKWMDDVIHFLCSMLAFEPSERPQALDVANIFGQVALQAPGEDLARWAGRMAGGGGRRSAAPPLAPPAIAPSEVPSPPSFEENLGGPEALGGPMAQGESLKIRQAASAKGESTAFWSRDRIAALLAEEDAEDEPVRAQFSPGAPRPAAPPSPPAPPMRPEPVQAPMGVSAPPRPVAPVPPPPAPAPPLPPAPDSTFGGHEASIPSRAPAPVPIAAPAPPPVAAAAPPRQPAPPVAAATPFAVRGPVASAPPPPAAEDRKGGGKIKIVIGVVLLFVFLCMGGAGVGGLVWYFGQESADTDPETPTDVAPDADEERDDAKPDATDTGSPAAEPVEKPPEPEPEPAAAPAPARQPARSSGSSGGSSSRSSGASSGSTSSRSSSSRPARSGGSSSRSSGGSSGGASTPAPAPAPPAGDFPAAVKFSAQGVEATLQCGDGQQANFVGSTRLTFQDVTTCRVKIGDAMGVVQITRSGSVTCAESGGRVACSGG